MASRRLSQAYDFALASEGVRVSQYALLNALQNWGEYAPAMQELADKLALDRTTLGHNLGPLARDGFVEVRTDPGDRRSRRIVLTAAGREKRQACFPLWRAAQDRFEEAFGRERSIALGKALLVVARQDATPASDARTSESDRAG